MCTDSQCLKLKHIVFGNELELGKHKVEKHINTSQMSRRERQIASSVPLSALIDENSAVDDDIAFDQQRIHDEIIKANLFIDKHRGVIPTPVSDLNPDDVRK